MDDAVRAFLTEIEDFLERSGMSATAFGSEAINDPSFVRDLRDGRAPGLRVVQKCRDLIARKDRDRLEAKANGESSSSSPVPA